MQEHVPLGGGDQQAVGYLKVQEIARLADVLAESIECYIARVGDIHHGRGRIGVTIENGIRGLQIDRSAGSHLTDVHIAVEDSDVHESGARLDP